jgi:hypothetical protein
MSPAAYEIALSMETTNAINRFKSLQRNMVSSFKSLETNCCSLEILKKAKSERKKAKGRLILRHHHAM